jgi:hypothetical protein
MWLYGMMADGRGKESPNARVIQKPPGIPGEMTLLTDRTGTKDRVLCPFVLSVVFIIFSG